MSEKDEQKVGQDDSQVPVDQRLQKIDELARDVLTLSRNTLLVNLRFLDMALSQFEMVQAPPLTPWNLATDGHKLYYQPVAVLKSYKQQKEYPVRQYLHSVFHCIFHHNFSCTSMNRVYWDLASDIAVEGVINEMGLRCTEIPRQTQQMLELSRLKTELKHVTAEKVYRWFLDNPPDDRELVRLVNLFAMDNHDVWYMLPDEADGKADSPQKGSSRSRGHQGKDRSMGIQIQASDDSGQGQDQDQGQGQSQGPGLAGGQGQEDQGPGGSGIQSQSGSGSESSGSGYFTGDSSTERFARERAELADTWKDIAERMQTDLETFSRKQMGQGAGSMIQNLREVTREKYDYSSFLRKFAVLGETMKINDAEFDYIFYTYGLKLYDNMPLIEPLEFKEVKRIREFVIALDTSGSVSGSLVQTFLQKTYNILKQEESFFRKINIHIIQCDYAIQEDRKITSQKEFDEYIKTMKLRGFGGTDFRPVFAYVDRLRQDGEFINLKGLIYFTDGYGVFPEKMPAYPTAFVFIDDENETIPELPPWAIKLVLRSDEV